MLFCRLLSRQAFTHFCQNSFRKVHHIMFKRKGGRGSKAFWTMFKKLYFSYMEASLRVSATLTSSQTSDKSNSGCRDRLDGEKVLCCCEIGCRTLCCFISELECGGEMYTSGGKAEMTIQHCKHKVHCSMCNWDSLASLGNVFGVCNTSWENYEIGRP